MSGKYAAMCAATTVLPWKTPTPQDYEALLQVNWRALHVCANVVLHAAFRRGKPGDC